MKIKLVTINNKNIQSAPSEIRTHDLLLASLSPLPIVLCYLIKIKSQLKVYEGEQLFVIFKNTNNYYILNRSKYLLKAIKC